MKRVWAGLVLFVLVAGLAVAPAADTASGTATLKGKVVYAGDPPKPEKLKFPVGTEAHCLKGDTEDLTWVVDPKTGGVANVVVWLRPAAGTPLPVPEKLRRRNDTVVFD